MLFFRGETNAYLRMEFSCQWLESTAIWNRAEWFIVHVQLTKHIVCSCSK